MAPIHSRARQAPQIKGKKLSQPLKKNHTRVHDAPAEAQADHPFASDEHDGQEEDGDEEIAAASNSYADLLQSLGAGHQVGAPRKKRKLNGWADGFSSLVHNLGNGPSSLAQPSSISPEEQNLPDKEREKDLNTDDVEDDDDESKGHDDPFQLHYDSMSEEELSLRIRAVKHGAYQSSTLMYPALGRLTRSSPTLEDATKISLQEKPKVNRNQDFKNLHLKRRLQDPTERHIGKLSRFESELSVPIFNYEDVLFCDRDIENAANLRNMASLHAINHIFKTRDKVLKNNTKLSSQAGNNVVEYRDQGFTRPKVLILLETRQTCVRYMDAIVALSASEQQENRKRFLDAFSAPEDKYSEDKPKDFRELFEGNDDNDFRIGVKFTRKTVKYYAKFYSCDIILASPLGLRRAINMEDSKKADYDFLSSIEILVMDQVDAMLNQNFEHVEHVLDHLNLQPKESHGCDFSRVRQWYLDQNAKFLRQTIIFSAYLTPDLNHVYTKYLCNVAGKVKIQQRYDGVMLQIGARLRQTFLRFRTSSLEQEPDDRFNYFNTAVLPTLLRQAGATDGALGCLVFIPSYLDFVRIRNHFASSNVTESISFGLISEYTETPDVRRARSHFFTGRNPILLYTGRAHHFRRYHIRGVKQIIFYGLPENPIFYEETVGGFLSDAADTGTSNVAGVQSKAIFSKYDGTSLERIVGSKRAARMLKEGLGDTFEFS